MKKGAVIIGVDKTGDLPILNAAGSGAIDFSNWANKQGFDVTLLTDANDRPVTVADISKAIDQYVQSQTYSQLFVYFSGHGILRGPDYELWLLSGSPANPNEAVNLSGSILMARNARIKHVVFISDACRSRPESYRLNQVTGSVIFPNEPPRTPRPTVDVFYATLPGDTALEIPPDQAVANYRGIFTECMLDGLNGSVTQVIVKEGQPPKVQLIVPSYKLKEYLESQVPMAASAVNIKLQQDPDIRVESHPPSFLSLISSTEPVLPIFPELAVEQLESFENDPVVGPKIATFKDVINSLQNNAFRNPWETPLSPPAAYIKSRPEHDLLNESVGRIIEAQGRESFETRTGFTVIGAEPKEALMGDTHVEIFEENGQPNIRIVYDLKRRKQDTSILIVFGDETGVLLAVLPGFIGTIVVEGNRVVTVNYTPSRNTNKYIDYTEHRKEIDERRAFVAVAARNGSFRLDNERAFEGAQYLRALKSLDPTLGLYAAYAYIQTGRIKDVQSLLRYMVNEKIYIEGNKQHKVPVLFDVLLLSGLESAKNRAAVVAPACPMLTQGWAYIESYRGKLLPKVLEAGQHLQPGLWTTFTKEGVSILREAIISGELI